MKTVIFMLFVLIVTSTAGFSQKKSNGFVYVGPAGYQPLKGGGAALFGGSAGFGVYAGLASLGIGVDMLSQRRAGFFGNAYADLRLRIKNAPTSPFILFQPGFVLRNKEIPLTPGNKIVEKGNLYLAGGAGLTSKTGKIGFTFQVKVAMMAFKHVMVKSGTAQSATYSRPGNIGVAVGVIF